METYKDANAYLVNDRKEFESFADEVEKEVMQTEQEKKETALKEYYNMSAGSKVKRFEDMIAERAGNKCYPTGFKKLDEVLDGGLYEGLYFIGAVSSLGKTTFCLQVADQLAAQGNDVLFFTLEQSEFELMAKSLSRITYKKSKMESEALTARNVMNGNANNFQRIKLYEAYKEYENKTENHLYFFEGVGDLGIEEVKARVEKHIEKTGNKPVVIIDYMQILAPVDMRASDKQNIDRTVTTLKRLSRDCNLPIIGISSFNRESYNNSVTMASFKESGAIEYSSDILFGLQPADMENAGESSKVKTENAERVDKCKKSDIREVELVILKNRNGKTGDKIKFDFYSKFNHFKEVDKKPDKKMYYR